ncbi:hypothetical protein ACTJI8_18035 [Microbacterium sp. 22303]|uniref:hypothetical protein n=1 Tax=Microbacterium sp. 22303 TaxID=3453905 RepID=UPI003F82590B
MNDRFRPAESLASVAVAASETILGRGSGVTPRAETPRTETPRAETPRAETPPTKTPRTGTPRAETKSVQLEPACLEVAHRAQLFAARF